MREIEIGHLAADQVIAPRPLVLFSGGLDSTFLLWDLMVNQKTDVDIIYAEGHQADLKTLKEKEQRKLIIARLQELSGRMVIGRYEVPHIVPNEAGRAAGYSTVASIGHIQSLAWFLSAFYTVIPEIHSTVQIAYVMGDTIIGQLYYMQQAWNNLRKFSCKGETNLIFPLQDICKAHILNNLPAELIELCWVCETPLLKDGEIVACNKCTPCRRHAMELALKKHPPELMLRETSKHYDAYKQGLKNVEDYRDDSDKVILLKQPSKKRPRRYTIRGGIRCTTAPFCAHRPYR